MKEKRARSLAKAISFRLIASLSNVSIIYLLVDDVIVSIAIGIVDIILKMTYQLYKNWSPTIARILMFCGIFMMGLSVVRVSVEKNYFTAGVMFLQGLFFVILWYYNDKKYFVRFEEEQLVFSNN